MGAGNAGSGGGQGSDPNYNSAGKLKDKKNIGDNKQSDAQRKSSIEKANKAKAKTKTKFGYTKPKKKNIVETIIDKSPVINLLKNNPISKKTEEVNRKFYEEKVVPAGKSTAPNYETYMKDRLSGKTDAYGNKTARDNDGENNNTPTPTPKVKVAEIPKVKTAPTEAEVSQSSATDTTTVEEPKKVDDIYTRKRKAKARGRSMMTLTGPRGLKKDEKLTLGRPSLLGS